jgi:dTDP-4-dehydrorhamnose reductase
LKTQPIWVTGAGGLIGSWLLKTAPRGFSEVIGLTRAQLDLTDPAAVRKAFERQRPGLLIHCAALSRNPACEANPALARKLNVEVTARLAQLAIDIPFIFFSTDLVFDGRKGNYDESAEVNPLSVYAETKAQAERVVLTNPKHTVVRTSLNCGISPTGDRGLDEQLCQAWRAGKILRLFTDEFRCPIPAEVTARAVWELTARTEAGLFHLAGSERLSRWQIGQLIAARCPELNPKLEPGSARDYSGPLRPADTSLNCAKIQKLLSFPLPGLSEWFTKQPGQPWSAQGSLQNSAA